MSYQDDLKKHLAEFKRIHLGIDEPGVFRYRGREIKHDHILPISRASANLLAEAESAASAFLNAHPRRRHRYFHHLNSSQAFGFNLFLPYFTGGPESASVLLRALGQEGVLAEWEAEKAHAVEKQSTTDMFWANTDGVRTFCEVKLAESEFGAVDDDLRHREKFTSLYAPILTKHLDPARLEPLAFFGAYQFNRNIWNMVCTDEDSRLIFLLPRSNVYLWALLQQMLAGVVPNTRSRISAVAIEDVLSGLGADDACPGELRPYPLKLKQKYLIPPRPAEQLILPGCAATASAQSEC